MINLLEKLPIIFYNTFFAFFTFVALISCMYILYLIFALVKKKIVVDSRYHLLFLYYAASVALFSAIGSLIYSEVVGFIPCTYCWYQRGVMYPLVILLIFMVVKKISNMPALSENKPARQASNSGMLNRTELSKTCSKVSKSIIYRSLPF